MSATSTVDLVWLGRIGYRPALGLQERLRAQVLAGSRPELILLLEHDPVITLGRSAHAENVLVDDATLALAGIERVATNRGGDVTYHGPGQLVAYPIVRLYAGPRAYIRTLAQAVIDLVAAQSITAAYDEQRPGVWVGSAKLCAFGVHVHQGVTIHGLALNVTTPVSAFAAIVPCGLADTRVTTMCELLAAPPPPLETLAIALGESLAWRLGRSPRWTSAADAFTERTPTVDHETASAS